jgi:predicted HicB family RNase H-like nuclease
VAGARQEELESFVSASSQREREGLVTESSHIRYCGRRSRSHERNLSLKPEVEKGLRARAHARGVSLDDYLQELVTKEAGLTVAAEPRPIQKTVR